MKEFLEVTKNDLIKKVKNKEYIPMTVFNLVFDENENSYNEFEQKGMTINENGVLTIEDNDICYVCDLKHNS